MNGMTSSLIMIFLSLASGYGFKRLIPSESILPMRRFLQKLVMIGILPVTVISSVWIAPIKNLQIIAMPFLGPAALASGALISLAMARLMKKNRRDRAVFFVSGGVSNLGSLGGLLAFLFLGEKGFALVSFYIFLEKFWIFGVVFPFARNSSLKSIEKNSLRTSLKRLFADPFVAAALISLAAGTTLNLTGIPRPDFFQRVNSVLVPLSTIILLFSIGLGMRLSAVGQYLKEGLSIVAVKTIFIPLIILPLALLLGLGETAGGLPLKVVMILCAMPVGFTALVPPSLYDLDLDLANSIWLISNGALLVVIPLLSYLVKVI